MVEYSTFYFCIHGRGSESMNNIGISYGILKGSKSFVRTRPGRNNGKWLITETHKLLVMNLKKHSEVTWCGHLLPHMRWCDLGERGGAERKRRWSAWCSNLAAWEWVWDEMRWEFLLPSAHLGPQETLNVWPPCHGTVWPLNANQLSSQLPIPKLEGKLGMLILLRDRMSTNGTANIMRS